MRDKYFRVNLFDKYIQKNMFNIILSFLSKRFITLNKLICRKCYNILTFKFIKNPLDPFNEPYNIYFLNSFNTSNKLVEK